MLMSTPAAESLLKFPTPFPIKAMGRMVVDGEKQFAEIVLDIVRKHAPDFDGHTIEMRASKNGNYLAVTATINATCQSQLDDIYRELSSHPLVLMAL
jgi:putative lipoic acid-binding regulatory protein